MIRTYARRSKDRFCLYVSGHAEKSAEGDRVCAAVSVLVGMLICHAQEHQGCRHVRACRASGSCSLAFTGALGDILERVLKTIDTLAAEYPAHVARVSYLCDEGDKK